MSTRCTPDNDYPNVPSLDPDLGTFHTCQFSESWLSIVLGAVERIRRMCWENPDDTLTQDFGVWDTLLDMIATEVTPGGDGLIVGEIKVMTCETSDPRLLLMNGQEISKVDYPDLFAAWGVTDPTMNLPSLSYRYLMGAFQNNPANARLFTGANTYALTPDQIPPHTHQLRGIDGGYAVDSQNVIGSWALGAGSSHYLDFSLNAHTLENATQQNNVNNQPASYAVLYYVVAST